MKWLDPCRCICTSVFETKIIDQFRYMGSVPDIVGNLIRFPSEVNITGGRGGKGILIRTPKPTCEHGRVAMAPMAKQIKWHRGFLYIVSHSRSLVLSQRLEPPRQRTSGYVLASWYFTSVLVLQNRYNKLYIQGLFVYIHVPWPWKTPLRPGPHIVRGYSTYACKIRPGPACGEERKKN